VDPLKFFRAGDPQSTALDTFVDVLCSAKLYSTRALSFRRSRDVGAASSAP